MKKIKFIFILFLISIRLHLIAQYEYPSEEATNQKKESHNNSKIYFGGNLGLWFGDITYIELTPLVGYKITPRLWAGGGPMYIYYKELDFYKTSIYGGKVFGQFFIFKDLNETANINLGDIYIYAENEILNVEPLKVNFITGNYYKDDRKWIDITLVGFGMRYPIGDRVGISLTILWDINQNPEYYYDNPEIRLSVDF
jgi:hypothetical protein